jgi:hypothetical protein
MTALNFESNGRTLAEEGFLNKKSAIIIEPEIHRNWAMRERFLSYCLNALKQTGCHFGVGTSCEVQSSNRCDISAWLSTHVNWH